MKQLVTPAIILQRTNYGEADRILTLLTPDHGKLTLLAKGVRRVKSKLAGGIELFSVSEITFIKGRGEVGTLVSTRLVKHYGRIVSDFERTMLGYDLIKQVHRATEQEPEAAYFSLLQEGFEALDEPTVPLSVIRLWFGAGLLRLAGHEPNLYTDTSSQKLIVEQTYGFDFEQMAFTPQPGKGRFNASHIKFLRLLFTGNPPALLAQVQAWERVTEASAPIIQTMLKLFVRV